MSALIRITELASQTFRQLVRMKVFYFLIFFALIVIGSSMFVLRYNSLEQELKLLKDFSFFAMTLFASLIAIVGTAMLIPRDIEDRTIYTILCKPVRRIEYLLGKLLGVIALIAVSLLLMDVLFSIVLYARQSLMLAEESARFDTSPDGLEARAALEALIRENGLTWSLQGAVVAIFLKACVITALSLLLSTFASSSLFTMVTAAVLFFAGHLQSDMVEFYQSRPDTAAMARWVAAPLAVLLPNFQLFNVVDAAVAGEIIDAATLVPLSGFAFGYVAMYLSAAWFLFSDREI